MSNALPLSMSNLQVPAAPTSRPRASLHPVAKGPLGETPEHAANGTIAPPASATMPKLASMAAPPAPRLSAVTAATTARPATLPVATTPRTTPPPALVPRTMAERMNAARERIRGAAESGLRMRSYEVALDLDLSEFHFARQFRAAFGRSPHVYYDEVRAERARTLLGDGLAEGEVARRVGLRRPAELRALLNKRFDSAAE